MPTPVTSNAGPMQRLQRFMEAYDKASTSPDKPREAAGRVTGSATGIDQLDDVRPSQLTAAAHQALLRDVFPDLSSGRPVDAGCMADEMRDMQQLLKGMESLGCLPAKGQAVLEVMQQLIGALEAASCRAPTLPPILPPPAGGAFVEPQPKVRGVYFENRVPDRRALDPLRLTFDGFEDGSHIAVRVRSNLGEVLWQELPSKAFEGRSRDGRLTLELGPDTLRELGCRSSDPRKDGVQAGEQLDIVVVRPGRVDDFRRMLTSADGLASIQSSAQRLYLEKLSDGTRVPYVPASDVVDIGTIERPRGAGPVALGDASVPQVDTRSLKVAHDGERFQLAAALNSLGEGTFMEPRATVMPFERMGYSDAITRRRNDLDGEYFHGAPVARKAFQKLTSDAEGRFAMEVKRPKEDGLMLNVSDGVHHRAVAVTPKVDLRTGLATDQLDVFAVQNPALGLLSPLRFTPASMQVGKVDGCSGTVIMGISATLPGTSLLVSDMSGAPLAEAVADRSGSFSHEVDLVDGQRFKMSFANPFTVAHPYGHRDGVGELEVVCELRGKDIHVLEWVKPEPDDGVAPADLTTPLTPAEIAGAIGDVPFAWSLGEEVTANLCDANVIRNHRAWTVELGMTLGVDFGLGDLDIPAGGRVVVDEARKKIQIVVEDSGLDGQVGPVKGAGAAAGGSTRAALTLTEESSRALLNLREKGIFEAELVTSDYKRLATGCVEVTPGSDVALSAWKRAPIDAAAPLTVKVEPPPNVHISYAVAYRVPTLSASLPRTDNANNNDEAKEQGRAVKNQWLPADQYYLTAAQASNPACVPSNLIVQLALRLPNEAKTVEVTNQSAPGAPSICVPAEVPLKLSEDQARELCLTDGSSLTVTPQGADGAAIGRSNKVQLTTELRQVNVYEAGCFISAGVTTRWKMKDKPIGRRFAAFLDGNRETKLADVILPANLGRS